MVFALKVLQIVYFYLLTSIYLAMLQVIIVQEIKFYEMLVGSVHKGIKSKKQNNFWNKQTTFSTNCLLFNYYSYRFSHVQTFISRPNISCFLVCVCLPFQRPRFISSLAFEVCYNIVFAIRFLQFHFVEYIFKKFQYSLFSRSLFHKVGTGSTFEKSGLCLEISENSTGLNCLQHPILVRTFDQIENS